MLDFLFNEIALVILTAGLLSLLFVFLRQPLIIAYIVTGLLVGPSLLGLARSPEVFGAMSEIGIAFLLFIVGLGLNWRNVKDVGRVAFFAGIGQVVVTAGLGYLLALWLHFDQVTSIFLGLGFAFSSTIIVMKLLSDKEDLDRFYGRISVGVLIVQDLVAMVVLLMVSALSDGTSLEGVIAFVTLKSGVVLFILWLFAKYLLPPLFKYAAQSQELLFLTALAWCFAVASGLTFFGFGIEIGALLAGLSLAGSEFQRDIELKIQPLRDFFLVIFFIVLGTTLTIESFASVFPAALLFSAFVLILNPLIVILILRAFSYHPRTGFMVGTTMAQISEFSFILFAALVESDMVPPEVLPLTTLVAMITIAGSTYLIQYNEEIYQRLQWMFAFMAKGTKTTSRPKKERVDVVLFGFEHLGEAILPAVRSLKTSYLVVDFDPARIEELKRRRIPHEYGDAGNQEFMHSLQLEKAHLVISTIPDVAVNLDIQHYLKDRRSRASVVLTAKTSARARDLYKAGATFVIVPNTLSGELFAQMLKKRKASKAMWGKVAKKERKVLGV